jgi:NDP-sugar pyrophosphorylase family protein
MMLFRKNDAVLDFDLAKVIEQSKDNAVFYVQYGHARLAAIFQKAAEAGLALPVFDVETARALALPEERPGMAASTYANIGLYDTALFRELPRHTRLKLLPLYRRWIADGLVSGEHYAGAWTNVGTPADLAALDARLHNRSRAAAPPHQDPLE